MSWIVYVKICPSVLYIILGIRCTYYAASTRPWLKASPTLQSDAVTLIIQNLTGITSLLLTSERSLQHVQVHVMLVDCEYYLCLNVPTEVSSPQGITVMSSQGTLIIVLTVSRGVVQCVA